MDKKKYHINSENVYLICPKCKQKVCGISQVHAEAVMKEHQKSLLCRKITHALTLSGANIMIANTETKSAIKGVLTK